MSTSIGSLELQIKSDSKSAADGIEALSQSLSKLKGVANGGTGLGSVNKDLSSVNDSISKSHMNIKAKFSSISRVIQQTTKVISACVSKTNAYIEDVNLFNVSMGEYAKEAGQYAERVGEVMGIDPGEWMRNQGVFMTLATGFGVVSDRAYTMSKNLTQLGYDISSFFNIPYEDAMQKLQSGLAGELEPLRRIGYDLSQARLQQEAYILGIDKKIAKMTQAEKAELRYHAIMTQVTTAQGDMARTLNAPANQLRVLKAQFTQAGRAIGSIFIPMLNAALPLLIVIAKAVRLVAETIAGFFGFEMPEVDYSGIDSLGNGADDAADALGAAADNAKKLKKHIMGFDELNVIDSSSGSDNDDSLGLGSGFEFELPEYDFLSDAVNTKIDKLMEKITPALETIKLHMDEILSVVSAIGLGVIAWNLTGIATGLVDAIKKGEINKVQIGITMLVTGVTLGLANGYNIGYEGLSWDKLILQALSNALIIGGSLLTFGTGPLGWAIGIGASLVIDIASIAWGKWEKAKDDDLANRFGEYVLSDREIAGWVEKLTTNDLSVKLDLYVDQETAVDTAKTQLETAIGTLNGYNFRIQCGLDVSQSEYSSSVDTMIESVENYIEQKQITAMMAVDIIYDGSETGKRLSLFTTNFYNDSYQKLNTLGDELKAVVSEGFVNGEWIPDKLQEMIDLQEEIQEILNYISTVEFEAKLTALKLDATSTDITSDSFSNLLEQAQGTVQEQLSNLEGVRLESLKVAKMEFDQNILNGMSKEAAQEIYDSAVAEAESKFREGKATLSFGTVDFGLDVIKSKYSVEIDKAVPILQQSTKDLFTQGTSVVLPEETYTNIDLLYSEIHSAYLFGLQDLDISEEARANIGTLMKQLEPTEDEYKKVVGESLKAGKAVPENVSKGLNDINMLKAISGDMESINYLIGQHLSTDQTFLDLLSTCEGAGASVGDSVGAGLLANTQVIEDAANGTITLMNDTIGAKVLEVTPELVQNLEDLGFNVSEGLKKGVSDNVKQSDYESIWSRIGNWFKNLFNINSPSKVFEEYGGYVSTGLFNGVDGGITEDTYKTIFGRISSALGLVKGDIVDVVNSILGFIEKMANGVIDGVNWMIRQLNKLKINTPDWVEEMFGISSFGFNISELSHVTIPRVELKANGGFVDTGQMFIAREAGAEMVGSIGRRTAVANNDQIVAGIASGVASANSESNALLREQNTLLRAMLEKESGVYLDGKHITKSVEKHQRERGRVLVAGGVY